MQCLKEEDNWLKAGLIRQPIEDLQYRLSKFVVKLSVKDGCLLYNAATGSLLFFENDADFQSSKEYLIANWFFVPIRDFDEFLWVDFLRDKKRELSREDSIKSYLIMTTMNCNARCFYCYEKGRKPISMTPKIANDVADFIIANTKSKKVKVSWFGGEPLVNYKAIDIICERLKQNGFYYHSHIISNGLLFSDELIERSKKLWNLKKAQITIDGTESVYLKTKAYKDSTGNEFQKVMSNIEHLLRNDVSVSIRLNQSKENTNDLLNLADLIKCKFHLFNNLSVYNRLLFEEKITDEVETAYFELKQKLIHLGLLKPKYGEAIKYAQCMADNDSSMVITPDGHIGKCEHFSEDYFVGSIYDKNLNLQLINQFKEVFPPIPSCNSCALYPSCVRIKLCPSHLDACTEFMRKDLLQNLHYMMNRYYQTWKKKKE